jgi:hypothetical protein
VIKNTKDVISQVKDDASRNNLYQMTRIIQASAFMLLTDSYGSIPYKEGGAGVTDQIFFPKYDTQEFIYNDLIKELTEASAALNPSGKIETADILYAGNIAKWKRFANSMLLRAGMRLSRVDQNKAKQVVSTAFAGGVILLNSDNAVILHDNNYQNPVGNTLN